MNSYNEYAMQYTTLFHSRANGAFLPIWIW